MGVIKNLKVYYRQRILRNALRVMDNSFAVKPITLLHCVREISAAWSVDVKQATIANCFKKCGFGEHSAFRIG